MKKPRIKYLKDYRPPAYLVDRVNLDIDLFDDHAMVNATLEIRPNEDASDRSPSLFLDGRELELLSIDLDGTPLTSEDYETKEEGILVKPGKKPCVLKLTTRIHPRENTSLEGLYMAGNTFLTQCEAEGFRRITYFPDRPDVMSRYTVRITADKKRYPVLLSNGDLVSAEDAGNGRHRVCFEDPFPKPCYLFALVAGDMACVEDRYVTQEGKTVSLKFFVDHGDEDKCAHAMESLKKSMRWDEETFGLSYDLSTYMIVSTHAFNAGAMENKGLNIFNSKYVLARPETATDTDYQLIEGVIGHEYFHNWTGNRVTLNSWFQLSLKEGLTVFRDQEFSSDTGSRAIKRITDVRTLRAGQFPEDSGPMAHPIRPESYIEMNNFYTATVYNKGAEVIRMIHTLLGKDGFRKGMDLYFQRFDGKAVTTEDFVKSMEDASSVDLSQFRLWYSQAGTPRIRVERQFDPKAKAYTLVFEQTIPDTPGQTDKRPMMIPVALSFLDESGKALPLDGNQNPTEKTLVIRKARETFRFDNIAQEPVPSLFRGFSAPVNVDAGYSQGELMFLMAHDTDAFNRWDAAQVLVLSAIKGLIESRHDGKAPEVDQKLIDAFEKTLLDTEADKALIAQILTIPTETELGDRMEIIDVEAIHEARDFFMLSLAKALYVPFRNVFEANGESGPYTIDPLSMARRKLKNTVLPYLALVEYDRASFVYNEFSQAGNMTDKLAALTLLTDMEHELADRALDEFYSTFKDDPLVMDKWLAVQAASRRKDTLDTVKTLTDHPCFSMKNPNKVRSLIGTFAQANPMAFHEKQGRGYAFLADRVIELDRINASVAARMVSAFNKWKRYDSGRKLLMKQELARILETDRLSKGVYEVVSAAMK